MSDESNVGKRVKIVNLNHWADTGFYNELPSYIGETGVVNTDYITHTHRLVINYDNPKVQEIDDENGHLCFRLENVEFLPEAQPKPPLGVIRKDIYEYQRIQDLARALHQYIEFQDGNYNLLIGWAEELVERLEDRNRGRKINDDEDWESL